MGVMSKTIKIAYLNYVSVWIDLLSIEIFRPRRNLDMQIWELDS